MKKRAILSTDIINDIFAQTKQSRKPSPYEKKYARHTYSIREELHVDLKDIAEREGVGLNDLVRFIFQTFVRQYKAGEIDLPVEEYVVTKSRLTE